MSEPPVIVFVDARRVELHTGATVLDAVRAFDVRAADAVSSGARAVTDSRGLPIAPDAPVHGGAILRLVSGKRGRAEHASSS